MGNKKIKIELNRQGVRGLLKSQKMMEICNKKATEIQKRAGDGYEISKYVGDNRVNVSVSAETLKARKDNAENNTLLRSLR